MSPVPYVGITGITSREQIDTIEAMLDELAWPSSHAVMLGVLVSGWTLEGASASNPRQYPSLEVAKSLVSSHKRVLNLVHYNNGRRTNALDLQLGSLRHALPAFTGWQLNFAWPNPVELYRAKRPGEVVVLQLGAAALRETGLDGAAYLLRSYGGIVDYALLDLSGGLGRPLEPAASLAALGVLANTITTYRLGIGLGVAGGLQARTIPMLADLKASFPGLSWDAQAGLRTPSDRLDLGRTRAYLQASLELIHLCGA